jgi:hypothetical protein
MLEEVEEVLTLMTMKALEWGMTLTPELQHTVLPEVLAEAVEEDVAEEETLKAFKRALQELMV